MPGKTVTHLPALGLALAAVAYVAIVLRFAPSEFQGDEASYLALASNLTRGYFSPPGEIRLWWGPGYPLILTPVVGLQLPLLVARVLNAGFMVGAVALTYRAAAMVLPGRVAAIIAAYLAVYLPALQDLPELLTEPLALLLASGWMYLFCKAHQDVSFRPARGWLLAASAVTLAYLALTKVFFGWVMMAGLALSVGLLIVRRSAEYRRWVATFTLSLLLCSPYLAYTYVLSGHVMYWGTSGGLSLYWMSTPYPAELGDWFPIAALRNDPRLAPEHARTYAAIENLSQPRQDDILRAEAIDNIRQYPGKYLRNWVDNIGRLLVNFPYSFTPFNVRSVGVALLNAPLVVLDLAALVLVIRGRATTPVGLRGVAMLATIGFCGSSLLSAYSRQLVPLVPWLAVAAAATVWPTLAPRLPARARALLNDHVPQPVATI